jgi:hypothetical protein
MLRCDSRAFKQVERSDGATATGENQHGNVLL